MEIRDFKRYVYAFDVQSNLKVKNITFNMIAEDLQGNVQVTDLQLQGGNQVTAHIPNTEEMLERKYFGIDENEFLNSVTNPVKEGVQPRIYTNVRNRFFNVVGRGHEVIALPNIYHEDYKEDLITSALNLNVRAKEDFDLLRVSTNDGALVEGRKYDPYEYPTLAEHPLNYKYTREFYFGGALAGDEIILNANTFTASLAGVKLPLAQGNLNINGHIMPHARQRYMMSPYGSFRVRLEFYKQVTEQYTNEWGETVSITYLKDVGIGFYGFGEFEQFKGRAKY